MTSWGSDSVAPGAMAPVRLACPALSRDRNGNEHRFLPRHPFPESFLEQAQALYEAGKHEGREMQRELHGG